MTSLAIQVWQTWIVLTTMPPFWETVQSALALRPQIFAQIIEAPAGLFIALTVVVLAGLSEALAQSLVLFINRISPRRFILAILLSAGTHFIGFLFWTATIWLVGVYLFERSVPYATVTRAVGLAYAPQLLGFFILTPFLGSLFALVIGVWSLLSTVIAVSVGLNLTIWQAMACSGLGWLLLQAWRRTLGRPVQAFERWLQRRMAGVPLQWTLNDLRQIRLPSRLRLRIPRRRVRSPLRRKQKEERNG
jgi:hypothetical protein